jgi:hypothetical protein
MARLLWRQKQKIRPNCGRCQGLFALGRERSNGSKHNGGVNHRRDVSTLGIVNVWNLAKIRPLFRKVWLASVAEIDLKPNIRSLASDDGSCVQLPKAFSSQNFAQTDVHSIN